MPRKRALVVDDSKSARVILSRMLEKYDIEVEMAESAEQAIEYLNHNRPDAIFMDHLMPGMDGLQAVQAIKSNPQTAMIPIMMYTSQEGELYVGQARALGAMGVLPKQVRPVDVSKVLYELHLLPDRRDMADPAFLPVELDGTPASGETKVAATEWTRRVEAVMKEQSLDLRRFIVASMDSFASRIIADVRDIGATPAMQSEAPTAAPPLEPKWAWMAAFSAVSVVAATCAVFLALTREELTKARGEIAALEAGNLEMRQSRDGLAESNRELAAALAANATNQQSAEAVPAMTGRSEAVPYGEIPFDRSRLEVLRELLAKLESQSFHGVVKITRAEGLFCLSGNATDGFIPANPTMPVSKCDLIGNPFEEALSGQQRQSLAFANLIASVRQRTAGAITVSIDSAGTTRGVAPYPSRNDSMTAGEWNKIASANNRVDFSTEATP